MSEPLVSVCVPAHDVFGYLPNVIGSVLDQTFEDWELVIANSATHGETERALDKIHAARPDPRVRIIRNPATFSMVENWNSAISYSRGEYLKLLCADDVLMPDCLQRQFDSLRKYPAAALASGSRVIINHEGKHLFVRNGVGGTGVYQGNEMIRRCLNSGTNIIGDPVNVLWRRSAMRIVGPFDPKILYCTDVEFWLRLLGVGDMYFDQDPVGFYRIHSKAAANRLAKITVEDFMRVAERQVALGKVVLPPWRLGLIRIKSWYKNIFRQLLYNLIG